MSSQKSTQFNRCVLLIIVIAIAITIIAVAAAWAQWSSSAWERNWLAGIPCHVPCWEGITPNRTTVTETLLLLEHNKQIGDLTHFPSDKDVYDEIFWGQWMNNFGTGRIVYDRTTSIVSRISLSFPHDFTLGEVIQVFGEPSHVLALAARNSEKLDETDYTLEIYWQTQGVMLEWSQESPPHS